MVDNELLFFLHLFANITIVLVINRIFTREKIERTTRNKILVSIGIFVSIAVIPSLCYNIYTAIKISNQEALDNRSNRSTSRLGACAIIAILFSLANIGFGIHHLIKLCRVHAIVAVHAPLLADGHRERGISQQQQQRLVQQHGFVVAAEQLDQQCVGCSVGLAVGESAVRVPCGHVLHQQCFATCAARSTACPVCRAEFVEGGQRLSLIHI